MPIIHNSDKGNVMESIFLNDEEFKLYVPGYYVSEDGKVYSYKSKKLLKWLFRGKGAKKIPVC